MKNMKSNKKNILIVIVAFLISVVGMSSCEKFLEIELNDRIPNENAISSTRDLQLVLNGAYDALQSGSVIGGNLVVYADLLADDTRIGNEQKLNRFGKYEIYNMTSSPQIVEIADFWGTAYAAINRANIVIYHTNNDFIDDPSFEGEKTRLKGEALFIRALCHFELVRFFALPYNVNTKGANNQLGIPYRTEPTMGFTGLHMERNTVEEVYEFIIEDLTEAENLLEQSGKLSSINLASASAATALLARVHFFAGNYLEAGNNADRVIESGLYQLSTSLTELFGLSGFKYNTEVIFQMINIITDNSNSLIDNYMRNKSPLFQTTEQVWNLYHADDLRRTLITKFFAIYYIKKYDEALSEGVSQPLNRIYIRLAEMHLIRAESNLLPGGPANASKAFQSYNALRERAFGENYVIETVLLSDLLDSVRNERRRELCFEGDRFHNLRRLQLKLRHNTNWNAEAAVFKIPAGEMSGNNLMVQNP